MKRIDSLIIRELATPWIFGVGLFTALLMAGTWLGRLTGLLADQAPPGLVAQLFFLYLPAIMVKTFTMAVLLASLLAFGRLSSDSEIVALRAAGASIFRIVLPVSVFSVAIAVATLWFGEQVMPAATSRSKDLFTQITQRSVKANQPKAMTVVQDHKLRLGIIAENVDPLAQALEGVTATFYDDKEQLAYILEAKKLEFKGLMSWNGKGAFDWRIKGGFTLTDPKFNNVIHGTEAWPSNMPSISQSFGDLTADRNDEFDLYSMSQLKKIIDYHKKQGDWKDADVANAEYGYWNKYAVAFSAIVFGTLGAVLGIRNHRTGTAAGFALAVAIIFGYVTLANFMNVWAMKGVLPAYAASFAPLALGLIAAAIIMWRRNA